MIEIHSHILTGLDDGASSQSESLRMLETYCQQGVTDIICTPHLDPSLISLEQTAFFLESVQVTLDDLRRQIAYQAWPVTLHGGLELMLHADLPAVLEQNKNSPLMSLAGTSYILVELPRWINDGLQAYEPLLFQLQILGYQPILAHPERSMHHHDVLDVLESWVDQERILLQINTSSLALPSTANADQADYHQHRRHAVEQLLERNLVHFAASDAHDALRRAPQQAEAYAAISRQYGENLASYLLIDNPGRLLADQPIYRFDLT
ncbi:MAG: CpsB/CapC family capsule biosynthesis tyrosine phosphatase [Clostridiaceae bacterium]|nr:CpsB/CapC family capsule biosynthesis tyrosine phosphatase [Clostridiaceae bacterium]